MLPTFHTRGMMENALGCSSFHGTISATLVLKIPKNMRMEALHP
jgi:hypothetical protein